MSAREPAPAASAATAVDPFAQMEHALRERDAILTLAEECAGIGVWDIDLTTHTARGTPQFFKIMGLAPTDERIPLSMVRALRHPDDQQRVLAGFEHVLESGLDRYEMEYRIRRPDGETRWIFGRGSIIRDVAGRPVRYSGVDLDITERKAAEAALKASEERLRLAQELAGLGIWDWDLLSGEMKWNANQWVLHAYEPRDSNPRYDDWKQAIHPEDRDKTSAAVSEAVAVKRAYEAEYRVVQKDGAVRWIASRGSVLPDETGKPARLLSVSVDITERRARADMLILMNKELEQRVGERTAALELEAKRRAEAEARLHQAQKMEAVGQLTGGIAHDFNNLLTVIIGNLDRLKRMMGPNASDAISRSIEFALQGATNAAQLTQRLLAFSRLQPLAPSIVSLNNLVSGMLDMIGRTLGETIALRIALDERLWAINADANQLESALLNLVVNARDAMAGGGELSITTENVDIGVSESIDGESMPAGQYVLLRVHDDGCGIPNELLNRIFEPFFTTKEAGKGSGLGLSMVYGFVKQSGGYIRVQSGVGEGTSVDIYLPRHIGADVAAPGAAMAPKLALEPARAGETILLVEDNAPVRQYALAALQDLGYRVLPADTANSAIELLRASPPGRLDLLFTDVVLPGGLTGHDLASLVREAFPDVAVLYTTGYTRNAIVHDGRLDPDVRLIPKPYVTEELARHVRSAIDEASSSNVVPFKTAL